MPPPFDWWNNSTAYRKPNELARYPVQDAGLTTENIQAFTEYTNALLKPRETRAQLVTVIGLVIGGIIGIIVCFFIITDPAGYKFDNSLKNNSLSTIIGILGFFAGSVVSNKK